MDPRPIRRRTWLAVPAILGTGLLAACGAGNPGGAGFASGARRGTANFSPRPADRVGLLAPLTGANAAVGDGLRKGAELALAGSRVRMTVHDTASTPEGATAAARAALAQGAGILLGPLTAAETASVANVAAGTPVLAFTSDSAQARANVWTLGLTPTQQMNRVVSAARTAGKTRFAAVLPQTEFGNAMSAAFRAAVEEAGGHLVREQRYGDGFNALNEAVRDVANYAARRGQIDSQVRALRARGDAAGRRQAAAISGRAAPPPDFDVLLIAESGPRLSEIASLLPYYDLEGPRVQFVGPALWANQGRVLGAEPAFNGAWFAAPDPARRQEFSNRWREAHGDAPQGLASLGFDAAGIVRTIADRGGTISPASLTASSGFPGADGNLVLRPDGQVDRSLALFRVERGRMRVIPDPEPRRAPSA